MAFTGKSISRNLKRLGSRNLAAAVEKREVPVTMPNIQMPNVTVSPSGLYQQSACYAKCSDITVAEGKGCYVWDTQGRKYLDVTSGIAVLSTGHCHPRVVEAVQAQAAKLMHGQLNCFKSHTMVDELIENLGPMMPEGFDTFCFDTTGTQAIEASVKLARRYTERPGVITLHGGFHGRSLLTTAMTSSNAGPRFPVASPLPGNVYQVTPPLAYRWGCTEEEAVNRAVTALEDLLVSAVPADQVACIVAESVLGEGGFITLPPAYMQRVRQICDKHGILLISDEVQAGAGRTGKMWGCQHFGESAKPDIIASAKGLASGMPLSMVCAPRKIMDAYTPGSHGGTYMGNAVACAAANATLKVFKEEGLLENVQVNGESMKSMITEVVDTYLPGGDVRGVGYMVGIEFRDEAGNPCPEVGRFVREHALDNNVLFYGMSGWYGNCMRVMPPLIANEHECLAVVSALEAGLRAWRQKVSCA